MKEKNGLYNVHFMVPYAFTTIQHCIVLYTISIVLYTINYSWLVRYFFGKGVLKVHDAKNTTLANIAVGHE